MQDIERQNFLNECKQEASNNTNSLEKYLTKHLNVLKDEVKKNNGVPPKHRIDEVNKFLND